MNVAFKQHPIQALLDQVRNSYMMLNCVADIVTWSISKAQSYNLGVGILYAVVVLFANVMLSRMLRGWS
jgi:hypothetical protein